MPKKIRDHQKTFDQTSKIFTISFWIADLAFVAFCHKINLLNRLLGINTWKMFTFKMLALAFPYYFM